MDRRRNVRFEAIGQGPIATRCKRWVQFGLSMLPLDRLGDGSEPATKSFNSCQACQTILIEPKDASDRQLFSASGHG